MKHHGTLAWQTMQTNRTLILRLHDRANIEQTSSRPDGTTPCGLDVGLGLAHS